MVTCLQSETLVLDGTLHGSDSCSLLLVCNTLTLHRITITDSVGCAASFIVMFIPPTSGRKAVRMRNALIITELSSLYAFLMSSWIEHSRDHAPTQHTSQPSDHVTSKGSVLQASVQVNGTSTDTTNANSDAWGKEFRARLEGIAEQIQILREQTAIAKWEGNIRGAWPRKEYERLVDREWEMLVALAQVRQPPPVIATRTLIVCTARGCSSSHKYKVEGKPHQPHTDTQSKFRKLSCPGYPHLYLLAHSLRML